MNTLDTNEITIAVGQGYTLKDDEVAINGHIFKKTDVELAMAGVLGTSDEKDVKVGIRHKGNRKETPAHLDTYDKWKINGVTPESLSDLVEQIQIAIQ